MPKRRPIPAPTPRPASLAPLRAGTAPDNTVVVGDPDDPYTQTLLLDAVDGHVSVAWARALLAAGVDPNTVNHNNHSTALEYAVVHRGKPGVLLHLLAAGADPNRIDHHQHTPLVYALWWRRQSLPGAGKIVELLEAVGARNPHKAPPDAKEQHHANT